MKKTWVKKQEDVALKQMQSDTEKFVFGYGGKRPNAGRKKGEPTTTLSFRVKASKAKLLKEKIKQLIAST